MTVSNAGSEGLKETKLPRRDWILLPILSLVTIGLLAGSAELTAGLILPTLPGRGEDCMVFNDPLMGAKGIPNCVSLEKIPEGQKTEYRFNSSGYRNDFDFGPKLPGTFRIVMIGGSSAAGFRVPEQQTLATLLPLELSRRTGRKIELYNEAMPLRSPSMEARHFTEIQAANPDMILWILSHGDIDSTKSMLSHWNERRGQEDFRKLSSSAKILHKIKAEFDTRSFTSAIAYIFCHAPIGIALQDFLYSNPSRYVKSSLMNPDYQAVYLKREPSAELRKELEDFDSTAANIERQAKNAGIPIVAVLMPDRTQTAMIFLNGKWPKDFDPYKIDSELHSIIVSHGGIYIDILPSFRAIPNPQLGWFAVDGHPNSNGHAIIARLLTEELTNGSIPALRAPAKTQTVQSERH